MWFTATKATAFRNKARLLSALMRSCRGALEAREFWSAGLPRLGIYLCEDDVNFEGFWTALRDALADAQEGQDWQAKVTTVVADFWAFV